MIKIEKIYPKDIIAFVVLVISMFLIYKGINHVVSGNTNGSNTTNTIYTVAANKVLYITGATLSWKQTAADATGFVILTIGGNTIAMLFGSDLDQDHDAISLSFPIPIKLTAAQTATFHSSNANTYGDGSIFGYLVDA